MKKVNANMPAMPTSELDSLTHREDGFDESGRYLISNGLTKREMFAINLMAAYRSQHETMEAKPEQVAEWAIEDTGALLKELEK